MQVAIVGAGIGGLTLGIALRRRGIPVRIYEQADELREVGAAVALSANGTRLLERLGMADELAAVSWTPTELIHRHGISGERIAAQPVGSSYREECGGPFYGLHRMQLQRILASAFGADGLYLDHRLTELAEHDDHVELRFACGRRARADVLVGADGVHSVVRDRVVGESIAVFSGTSGFRGLVPIERLGSLPDPGAIQYWMGPDAHLLHYPIGDGSLVNFLAVLEGPRRWTQRGWMTETDEPGTHLAAFDDWHPAVREMLDAVPMSPRWALFGARPLRSWSRGRAVLLGDAAHPMLPHHGQGANQAIEDALTLAGCLAESGAPDAFRRYERLRRARTRKIQLCSWDTSDALHLADGTAAAERDARLRGLRESLGWIHRHDAEKA